MERTAEEVAQAHLDAVESGDPVAMAADYAETAVLVRGAETFIGRAEIQAYFATVPERLGNAVVVFDSLRFSAGQATFDWHLEGAPEPVAGTDVCRIIGGEIVHQVVNLRSIDF